MKKHILEPGSRTYTLCTRDTGELVPFPQTERELQALPYPDTCEKCRKAARKQLLP